MRPQNQIAWQDLLPTGPQTRAKQLIIGVALSGAKFTPINHEDTGDPMMDTILRGDRIVTDPDAILDEIERLHEADVRYFHWHGRNPLTREQSCDPVLYSVIGKALRNRNPEIILSYGGSRNGDEIRDAMRKGSEWARLQQTGLARHEGGADFVTIQAASELKIVMDLEAQGFLKTYPSGRPFTLLKLLDPYQPSRQLEDLSIGANATARGANYGRSSAFTQLEVLKRAIRVRGDLGLPQEVEWTQLSRSHALTKLMLDHFTPHLGNTGRLNITILFGFSPLLPFPLEYHEFRHAVSMARSLKQDYVRRPALDLTIAVGAAVMPRDVEKLTAPLDVGPESGRLVGPLERLIAYACMPDSGVDVLRFGLEDMPFLQGPGTEIAPATNLEIARVVMEKLAHYGGEAVTDPVPLRHFVTTEARARQPLGL